MITRQTRIFVPATEAEEDWFETLLGRVIAPLVTRFEQQLQWFWFSRYGAGLDDTEDFDLAALSEAYLQPLEPDAPPFHRSIRFRFAIAPAAQEVFEHQAEQQIDLNGYRISDFRDYDFVADTGSSRFLGIENRQPHRAEQRALLVTQFYMACSRLVLDTLIGPDATGRYRQEKNDDIHQNPNGSSFQSIHHLFCNITGTPTDVHVYQKEGLNILGFGTFMYPPPAPPGGWDKSSPHPIWF